MKEKICFNHKMVRAIIKERRISVTKLARGVLTTKRLMNVWLTGAQSKMPPVKVAMVAIFLDIPPEDLRVIYRFVESEIPPEYVFDQAEWTDFLTKELCYSVE